MGPLANSRRAQAIEALVDDALGAGGRATAGSNPGGGGWFHAPTVLTEVPSGARIMNEEPFGPVAVVNRFERFEDAIAEANRLPFGLSAFVFTRDLATAQRAAAAIESGMVSINTGKVAWPETPFGGVKDSGSGSEGGMEGLEGYTVTKSVSLAW
jgi:succinate-semialdehyde dehydrogenase/glutarate-semialdehyde dehydrogenase